MKSVSSLSKNKKTKIGSRFKIGDYCNFSLSHSSSFTAGNSVNIKNFCMFFLGDDSKLILGNRVFMNNSCSVNVMEHIEIGENTLFGEGVKLYDHNHQYGYDPDFKVDHQKFKTAQIIIGKNCWLGSNVIVLKGVTIGDNVIIGAGCVIHKDVPSNSIIINKQEQSISKL